MEVEGYTRLLFLNIHRTETCEASNTRRFMFNCSKLCCQSYRGAIVIFRTVDPPDASLFAFHDHVSMRTSLPFLKRLPCSRSLHSLSVDPLNAFISYSQLPTTPPEVVPSSPLAGQTIALKDNICTNDDLPTSCASRMLQGTFTV